MGMTDIPSTGYRLQGTGDGAPVTEPAESRERSANRGGESLRYFAAEPGADKEDECDGEDGGAGWHGNVEVAVGVVDVVVADEVPAKQRDDGEETGREEGEESGGDGEQEGGEQAEVAEGDAEEFCGFGGGGHGISRVMRCLGDGTVSLCGDLRAGLDSLGRSPIAEIERVLFQNGAGRVLWGESRIDLH